jgi:hypothetical protein
VRRDASWRDARHDTAPLRPAIRCATVNRAAAVFCPVIVSIQAAILDACSATAGSLHADYLPHDLSTPSSPALHIGPF